MKTIRIRPTPWATLLVLVAVLPLLGTTGLVLAQASDYAIGWWTADGGGSTWSDTGGQYVLNGTVGQPDAHAWGDGNYTLVGGFWGDVPQYKVYLPLVLRND